MQVDYVRVWAAPAPAPAPDRDAAPVATDTIAPNAQILGGPSQRLGPAVRVTVHCPDETCRATATATVHVPKLGRASARTFRPRPSTATIAKGMTGAVKLRLSSTARAAITRALRAGRRVVATVRIRVEDGAGNTGLRTRRISLRR